MRALIKWKCSKPAGGLGVAMERITQKFADDGEYTEVDILYGFLTLHEKFGLL